MTSSTTMTSVIGSIFAKAPAPAVASTTSMASGPYATELSASSDSAAIPSKLEISPLPAFLSSPVSSRVLAVLRVSAVLRRIAHLMARVTGRAPAGEPPQPRG